jgi:hypothetical protein
MEEQIERALENRCRNVDGHTDRLMPRHQVPDMQFPDHLPQEGVEQR